MMHAAGCTRVVRCVCCKAYLVLYGAGCILSCMLYGMRWQIQHAWAEFCTMMLFVFIGCGTAAVRSVSATQAAQHALIGAHLRIG